MNIQLSYNETFIGKPTKNDADWESFTKSFNPISLDVEGLIDRITSGQSITAHHHTRRNSANFISAQHIGLDFDQNSLDELDALPFITQYAAFTHTTSSHTEDAPRSRAFFILDAPIFDAAHYTRLVTALVWKFEQSDERCTDPCRVWFGAVGATVWRYDNVLTIEVAEGIADEYDAWQAAQIVTVQQSIITQSIEELLDKALREGVPGNRHHAGFDLACNLRDSGVEQLAAKEVMLLYQTTVSDTGDHPYTEQEALATLIGVYAKSINRQPAIYTNHTTGETFSVEDALRAVENAAVHGQLLTGRTKHQDRKVLFGAIDIMRKAHSVEVALSVRSVMEHCNLSRGTVANALHRLSDQGILVRTQKSNRLRASVYRLGDIVLCVDGFVIAHGWTSPKEGENGGGTPFQRCPTVRDDEIVSNYASLNQEDAFVYGAKVIGEMSTSDDLAHINLTYGPVCQSIIAHLIDKSGVTIKELSEMAGCHYGTARRKVKILENAGIIEVSEEWRSKIVVLSDEWYERLQQETIRLNTYGHRALIAERNAQQRIRQHEYFLDHLPENEAHSENREISERTVNNAVEDLGQAKVEIDAYNQHRKNCASLFEIENPDLIPHISLRGNQTKEPSNEIRVNGRVIVPEKVNTKPNSPHRMDFGIESGTEQERLDELMSRPIGHERAELEFLADRFGIPLEWEKIELVTD